MSREHLLHAKKLRADHRLAASKHRAVLKSSVQVLSVLRTRHPPPAATRPRCTLVRRPRAETGIPREVSVVKCAPSGVASAAPRALASRARGGRCPGRGAAAVVIRGHRRVAAVGGGGVSGAALATPTGIAVRAQPPVDGHVPARSSAWSACCASGQCAYLRARAGSRALRRARARAWATRAEDARGARSRAAHG